MILVSYGSRMVSITIRRLEHPVLGYRLAVDAFDIVICRWRHRSATIAQRHLSSCLHRATGRFVFVQRGGVHFDGQSIVRLQKCDLWTSISPSDSLEIGAERRIHSY